MGGKGAGRDVSLVETGGGKGVGGGRKRAGFYHELTQNRGNSPF